jgi:hypothetical protein
VTSLGDQLPVSRSFFEPARALFPRARDGKSLIHTTPIWGLRAETDDLNTSIQSAGFKKEGIPDLSHPWIGRGIQILKTNAHLCVELRATSRSNEVVNLTMNYQIYLFSGFNPSS